MDVNNPLKMVLIGIDPYPDEQSSEEFRDVAQTKCPERVTWTMKSVELRFSCRGLFRAASARWQAAGDQFTVGSWAAVFSRWANGFVTSWSFLNDQQFFFHLFSNIIRNILSYFKPCLPVSLFQVQQEIFEGLTDTRHMSFFFHSNLAARRRRQLMCRHCRWWSGLAGISSSRPFRSQSGCRF